METVSATDAIARLRALRTPGPDGAALELNRLAAAAAPLRLFREMFRREFAACERATAALPPEEGAAKEAILRLAELLNRRHFPTDDFCFFAEDFGAEGLDGIPVGYYLSFEWWNVDMSEAPSVLRLGCLLIGAMTDDDAWDSFGFEDGPPEEPLRPTGFVGATLEALCRRERGPARALLLALKVLEHETGNVWIDVTTEAEPEFIGWARDSIEWAAREWRAAQRILDRVLELSRWIDEDPPARAAHLVGLWNRGVRTAQ